MRAWQVIYEKQGRSAQYASEAERDDWVNKEIKGLQKGVNSKQAALTHLQKQAAASAASCTQLHQVCSHPALPVPLDTNLQVAAAAASFTQLPALLSLGARLHRPG